jgi:NAD-reducing hydrogenase small subunit
MGRVRFATLWLGGCSGCHMSFLDLDEFLIDLAELVEVVYSPIVDFKDYPENVDVALVEGAVCNEENLEIIKKVRQNTKVLISFGDCAVTGNVSAIRNVIPMSVQSVLQRSYLDNGDLNAALPVAEGIVPRLLDKVVPVHDVVPVDIFLPGCPPSAPRIKDVLVQLLETGAVEGRPDLIKFG